ncbi:5-methylcytosine restriction system specificity protein McrC [Prevotella fusca]
MITLIDNKKYSFTADNIEDYLPLQNIANRQISELLDEHGKNILIYPHSFLQCEDETEKQSILLLQTFWKENKCTKVILETGNIAGFIGVNELSVSIHSRFSQSEKEDFFLHYMLHKVLNINIVSLKHEKSEEQIFNFLLYLFPKYLNEALQQGIYKEYQLNKYNDIHVRGTIDISRHFKKNLPFNGCIAYRTREFDHDNHVTELIRHTIDYICKTKTGKELLENDADTRACVAQIVSATPHYKRQERERIIQSNLKSISHPYYTHYAPLQKLCLRILRHEKIKYGRNHDKIHGIMFDVSYLWEEYLAKILIKQGFKHPNNKKGIGHIYLARNNHFLRYPDFYREHDQTVIDAKYKKDINRDDVHQMVTYMYRLKAINGIFALPTYKKGAQSCFELLGYGALHNAKLQTYFFPITQTASNYKEFSASMKLSEERFEDQFKQYHLT